jgi:hypothetical protein
LNLTTAMAEPGLGTAPSQAAGEIGNSVYFQTPNEYWGSYASSSVNAGLGTSAVSISAWVYVNSFVTYDGTEASFYGIQRSMYPDDNVMFLFTKTGLLEFRMGDNATATWYTIPTSSAVAQNQWNYLCGTYDGTTMAFYLNGQLVGSLTASISRVDSPVYLDRLPYSAGQRVSDIRIDEARLSNAPRTSGWIATEYNNQNSPGTFFNLGAEQMPPTITSITPTSGVVGASVTIAGTNFGPTQGSSTVTFNGAAATPTSWSATSIVVPVPPGATTGNVVVTVGAVPSSGWLFTVTPTPSISGISPNPAPIGTPVTIAGTNFGSSQGSSTVTFNGTAATPSSWSATNIVVPVPSAATTGNVVVTVGGVASSGWSFTVAPTPSITGISPNPAPVGTPVTITGTNFGSTQGSSAVTFNGAAATPTSWSATSIIVAVPSGATSGNVVVTVGGVASNGATFTITPQITSLSPTLGPIGSSVTIAGANFGSSQGSSTVTFGSAAASVASWSATSLVVAVPAGVSLGTQSVVVTVGGFASAGSNFTVTPGITNLSPASGPIGTSVTITGTSFGSSQGSSTVAFGSTIAPPSSWGATSIVVAVPAGASTGNVVVTVGAIASNGVNFTVTTPAVTIGTTPASPYAPGAQLSISSNQSVSWTVTPPGAGTFNPTATSANQNTTFTVTDAANALTATITATNSSSVAGTASITLLPPVSITPSSSGAMTSGATQTFSANIPVNWSLSPSNGGTFSLSSTSAGQQTIFTMGSAGVANVTITAADQRYGTNTAWVAIGDPPTITPSSTPSTPLLAGGSLTISANQAVTWSVSPASAGSFASNSSAAGVNNTFTAANPIPNSALSATITATSTGGSTAQLVVNLAPAIVITPSSPAPLSAGATATFSANIPVNWTVPTTNGGTVSPAATSAGQTTTFTAGTAGTNVTLKATDQRFSTNSASVTIPPGTVATPSSVTPSSAEGTQQTFAFVFNDTGGGSNLTTVSALIGTSSTSFTNSCIVVYNHAQNTLALLTDSGGQPPSTITLPSSAVAQNSQCILNGSGSSVSVGASQIALNLSIGFTETYTGSKTVYGAATDASGYSSGWASLGSYWVDGVPRVLPMNPTNGQTNTPTVYPGTPLTVNFHFDDGTMPSDIAMVEISFGAPSSGSNGPVNGCDVMFNYNSGTFYLADNNGNWSTTLSNSQCSVSSPSYTIDTTVFPHPLSVTLTMQYASSYDGFYPIYGMAQDQAGQSGGWVEMGTLTVYGQGSDTISSVEVNNGSSGITLNPGQTAQVEVQLTQAAPAGGAVVTLQSTNASALSVPANITIPAGSLSGSATVTAQTLNGASSVGVYVEASYGAVQQAPSPLILVAGVAVPITTITTSPPGLTVTVDGINQTTPYNVPWPSGASHTITVPSPQMGGTGTQYVNPSWSGPTGCSNPASPPSASLTCTAVFQTQYTLTTAVSPPGGGTITPATGWQTPPVSITETANSGYQFSSFSCTSGCTVNGNTLTMTGPATVTANFTSTAATPTVTSIVISPSPLVGGGSGQITVTTSAPMTVALSASVEGALAGFPGSLTTTPSGTITQSFSVNSTPNLIQEQITASYNNVAQLLGNFTIMPTGTINASSGPSKEYVRLGGRVIAIENPPAAPVMSPAPGAYSAGQAVTLTGAAGTTVYYTTNGTIPSPTNGISCGGASCSVQTGTSGAMTITAVAYVGPMSSTTTTGIYTIATAELWPHLLLPWHNKPTLVAGLAGEKMPVQDRKPMDVHVALLRREQDVL